VAASAVCPPQWPRSALQFCSPLRIWPEVLSKLGRSSSQLAIRNFRLWHVASFAALQHHDRCWGQSGRNPDIAEST